MVAQTSWISASHQVNSALFFNSCYFHNVGFSTAVCPRCAPGIGGGAQRKFGGTLKKIFWRFAPEFVPPTSKLCRRLCWPRSLAIPHMCYCADWSYVKVCMGIKYRDTSKFLTRWGPAAWDMERRSIRDVTPHPRALVSVIAVGQTAWAHLRRSVLPLKIIGTDTDRFLLTFRCNHGPILHRVRDITRCRLEIAMFWIQWIRFYLTPQQRVHVFLGIS